MNIELIVGAALSAITIVIWIVRDRRDLNRFKKSQKRSEDSLEVFKETSKPSFIVFGFILMTLLYWGGIHGFNKFIADPGSSFRGGSSCGRYDDCSDYVDQVESGRGDNY